MAPSGSKEPRSLRPWFQNPSLSALRHEMNELFENFLSDPLAGLRGESLPRVDIVETPEAIEVTTDLPGFKPDDIHIEVADNHLTLSGKHSEESSTNEPDRKYHRLERRQGSFSRTVWLPCPVNEEQVDAQLSNGTLKIRLAKLEAAKRRTIPVRSEGGGP